MSNNSIAFVANKFDVNCNLPFEVIEGCYFQKANSTQIELIKKHLSSSGYFGNHILNLFSYELVYIEKQDKPNEKKYISQYLEPEYWKYYVLSFKGNNSKIYDLAQVANFTELELEIGLSCCAFNLLNLD